MVARTRFRQQRGGGDHTPRARAASFKAAQKTTGSKYTWRQKVKSAPHGAMARTVGLYQGLSKAVLGATKRGSEWLTRRAQLGYAKRTEKKAQHAINVELGLRKKGLFGYSKTKLLKDRTKYEKMQSELANITSKLNGNKYTTEQNIEKATARKTNLESKITKAKNAEKTKLLFTGDSLKTKEQLRTEKAEAAAAESGTPKEKAIVARLTQKQDALAAARAKVAERRLLLAKSGEEFKRLGSNIKQSYKQGKADYNAARLAYQKFTENHKKLGFIGAPIALGAYLAYKAVARPLVDTTTELLNTKAGRSLSRVALKAQLPSDSISLAKTIMSHQEKATELSAKIQKLQTDIKTQANLLPSESILKTNTDKLSTQLETINKARTDINLLRQKLKQTQNPTERADLLNNIQEEADKIKKGKTQLAELRQFILAEQTTSPENAKTVKTIISNFDNALATLTQRNRYLDLAYDAERAIVKKAAKGQKFLDEIGPETQSEIQTQLKKLKITGLPTTYKKNITDDTEFTAISKAFETVKQKMRESESIGQAKQEFGNTYRYLNALLNNYGETNLVNLGTESAETAANE